MMSVYDYASTIPEKGTKEYIFFKAWLRNRVTLGDMTPESIAEELELEVTYVETELLDRD